MNKTVEIEQKCNPVISISNQIIYGGTEWSVKEFNLFCIFLSLIKKWDNATVYEISVKEIMDISGREWNYGDFTKSSVKLNLPERVMAKPITIFRGVEDYTVILPFNLLNYKDGIIHFQLTDVARPLFVELAGNFTQINLNSVLNLTTYPSKILYLAIKSELYKSNFHLSFDIEDYKKLINVSLNTEPKRLKKKYIIKPLQEVQQHLPVQIDYRMQKAGTSYKKIDFFPIQSVETVWSDILDILRNLLPAQDFKTWFEPIIPIKLTGKKLIIEVPSEFCRQKIESTYLIQFSSAIKSTIGKRAKLEYQIKKS